MSLVAPSLPTDTLQDKRVRVSTRERVDAADYRAIGETLSQRIANTLRTMLYDVGSPTTGGLCVKGFVTKEQAAPNMSVRITPETGQNYSALLHEGYLAKETAASVTQTIDSEATLTNRIDVIAIRYVEDETDQLSRPVLTQPTITEVVGEAPGSGIGDGVTTIYDLANPSILPGEHIATVNGLVVAHSIVHGRGAGGKDQIVFANPPANGAAILVDYAWLAGGLEQATNVETRYTSKVEYQVIKGTANGVEPTTPAGWMRIARIAGITTTTTTITNSMITKLRTFWYGLEGTALSAAGGSMQKFIEDFGFLRNGFFPTLDLLAASTLDYKRTGGTEPHRQQISRYFDRASTTDAPFEIDAQGRPLLNAKRFRDDFELFDPDAVGTDKTKRWRTDTSVGATFTAHNDAPGALKAATSGTLSDTAVMRSHYRCHLGGSLPGGLLAGMAKHVTRYVVRLLATANVRMDLQLWRDASNLIGFSIDPTAQINGTPNWVTNHRSGGSDNFQNTTVAGDTNYHLFEIVRDATTVNTFYMYIDKVRVTTLAGATLTGGDDYVLRLVLTNTTSGAVREAEYLLVEHVSGALF